MQPVLKNMMFFLIWTVFTPLVAQEKAQISFDKSTHDFGTIKEEDGSVSYQFDFTNNGKTPVIIEGVRASCGCTTPGWTKDPVLPGKKGYVKALYNPKNRPGIFHKTLTVNTNADPSTIVLHIKGTVQPKPKTPAEEYPTALGGIRLKYNVLHVGKINNNGPVSKAFEVFNDSEENITFIPEKTVAPDYISFKFIPQVLKPSEKGNIVVVYDPVKKDDLGYVSDNATIFTNEEEQSAKKIRVVSLIEEYFPPMTEEELAQAPKINFDKVFHDFGNISKGESVSTDFTVTNQGKEDLIIRKTKANCGCTASDPVKDILKPGESTQIKVTFNSTGRTGTQQKSVTVFSNDPRESMKLISIKARID